MLKVEELLLEHRLKYKLIGMTIGMFILIVAMAILAYSQEKKEKSKAQDSTYVWVNVKQRIAELTKRQSELKNFSDQIEREALANQYEIQFLSGIAEDSIRVKK